MIPPPPTSSLFPYTTLFRSRCGPFRRYRPGDSYYYHLSIDHLKPELKRPARAGRFAIQPDAPSVVSRAGRNVRSEEHTSELQSRFDLVCRLLLEKKKKEARH